MMTNKEVALKYLRYFCAADIDKVEPLLAANLRFNGTFHSYRSARDYLDALRSDPPEECPYKLLSVTENENCVAVFYEYEKPDRVMQIAQLFKIKDAQIQEVLLVFDGRDGASPGD